MFLEGILMRKTICALAATVSLTAAAAALTLPSPAMDAARVVIRALGGSVTTSLAARLGNAKYVGADFGADLTGATDATAALQSCLTAAGSFGGVCRVEPTAKLLVVGNITEPPGVTLDCGDGYPGLLGTQANGYLSPNWSAMPGIRLNKAATIIPGSGGTIKGCLILQSGLSWPQADASNYAGTAITLKSDTRDVTMQHNTVVGFNTLIAPADPTGVSVDPEHPSV